MTSIATGLRSPRRLGGGSVAGVLGIGVVSVLTGDLMQSQAYLRVAIAACVSIAILGVATQSPRVAFLCVMIWLAALGLTRRLVDEITPAPQGDPLLLVLPIAFGGLFAVSVAKGALRGRTRLASSILVLCGLIVLGALNPLGGNLIGGVAGLLFLFVPVLAFWFGRIYCDDRLFGVLLTLLAVLGVVTAFYGIVQTVDGFPAWDRHWIATAKLVSLNFNGVVRPFSTFSSSSEYGAYLALSALVWALFAGRRAVIAPIAVAAITLIVFALVYQSSRSAVVFLVVSLGMVAGARFRLWLPAAAIVAAAFLVVLVFALHNYGPASSAGNNGSPLVSHEIQGLANPLDPQSSTAIGHVGLVLHGLKEGFLNPVGRGIGAVTIAGGKFGGAAQGTEADPSNIAVGLGIPGLAAYLAVLGLGFTHAYRLATRRRDTLALAALGLLTVTLFQWLNGEQYSIAPLPWLVLGWVDRHDAQLADK